jgi:hypothetical protein
MSVVPLRLIAAVDVPAELMGMLPGLSPWASMYCGVTRDGGEGSNGG